ncbi:hypothetical protein [Streptomyces sp. NPDC006784]|uniref:hypothetical protein n=1 Tax=Streptomyces sp. NPDC006784 TaxID=3364764 RepID=UPI0036A42CA4
MSDYHDLFLAVDLRPDLPEPVLAELRWLLGQADMPAQLTSTVWESWGGPWAAFDGGSASHAFGGADVSLPARAVDRPDPDGGEPWALTVRTCVHEDDFGVTMDLVGWLLRYATTHGWVGFVRDSDLSHVRHLVRDENGSEPADVRPDEQQERMPRATGRPAAVAEAAPRTRSRSGYQTRSTASSAAVVRAGRSATARPDRSSEGHLA